MTTLKWIGEAINEDSVIERRFDIENNASIIPGILWTPTRHDHPTPLVLMGHGGSSHKRADRHVLLAYRFAKEFQIASAAIDGPFHGDRVSMPLEPHEYLEKMMKIGVDKVTDNMVNDWLVTWDALSQLDLINPNRIAYLGLSMGTRFGIPFLAAAGDQLCCALLGKNGMRAIPELTMNSRFRQDAPKIKVPVLFHVQLDDELFPHEGQFELFDLISSHDKCMIAFPGLHGVTTPSAIQMWCKFITDHLLV